MMLMHAKYNNNGGGSGDGGSGNESPARKLSNGQEQLIGDDEEVVRLI